MELHINPAVLSVTFDSCPICRLLTRCLASLAIQNQVLDFCSCPFYFISLLAQNYSLLAFSIKRCLCLLLANFSFLTFVLLFFFFFHFFFPFWQCRSLQPFIGLTCDNADSWMNLYSPYQDAWVCSGIYISHMHNS